MGLPITLSEIAPRISAGAFILNSGLGKRGADEQAAAGMHGFAAGTYPFLKNVPPQQFAKALSTSEIAIGARAADPVRADRRRGRRAHRVLRRPARAVPADAGHAQARQPRPDRAGPGDREGQLAARDRHRAAHARHHRPAAAAAGAQGGQEARQGDEAKARKPRERNVGG